MQPNATNFARPHEYYAAQGKTLADYYRYFERDGKPDYWKQRAAIEAAKGHQS